jgi:hypothetical protein
MNREEYRENQRLASIARKLDYVEMPDYLGIGDQPNPRDEKVVLYSVPEQKLEIAHQDDDPYFKALYEYKPDLIFVQTCPMNYIARQRYISHQVAMRGDTEYSKKATFSLDNPIPLTWDECAVNLITLDSVRQNLPHDKLNLTKSLATYSYPTLQSHSDYLSLTDPFVDAIKTHIMGKSWSKYLYLNNLVFLALMGKSRVILGDMPEPLLRMQLGNTVPIQTVREIYEFVTSKMAQHYAEHPDLPVTMEEVTLQYFPHIFQMPRDLYVTALLKEAFPSAMQTAAFVGAAHYVPLQRYWVGPPAGINYTQATQVPPKIATETEEDLIEKQALFDLLLDSKVWGQTYLTNPFPYLCESVTELSDFKYYKAYFAKMHRKYTAQREIKLETRAQLK